jgi:hypothetical protein
VIGRTVLEDEFRPQNSSLWWKDVCFIGQNLNHNWFSESVIINWEMVCERGSGGKNGLEIFRCKTERDKCKKMLISRI